MESLEVTMIVRESLLFMLSLLIQSNYWSIDK